MADYHNNIIVRNTITWRQVTGNIVAYPFENFSSNTWVAKKKIIDTKPLVIEVLRLLA